MLTLEFILNQVLALNKNFTSMFNHRIALGENSRLILSKRSGKIIDVFGNIKII